MKKKVALTAAAVALVGTLAVGGTLAWFTDTEEATNVVTMGEVDIKLSEDGGNDGIIKDSGLKYEKVMPGDIFQKTVTIENMEQAAWVRATIEVTGLDRNHNITFLKNGSEVNNITWNGFVGTTEPWKMEAYDAQDTILFDQIQIPTSWGNEMTNQEFSIKVSVEAVQYDNNTDSTTAFSGFTTENPVPNLKDGMTGTTDDQTGTYKASGSEITRVEK